MTSVAICALLLTSCGTPTERSTVLADATALETHLERITAAERQGNRAGTTGERAATTYTADFFRSLGLRTTLQSVPLARLSERRVSMTVTGADGELDLTSGEDYLVWSRQPTNLVSIDAELVFVGYGVTASEPEQTVFRGIDVAGKVIVALDGDPRSGVRDTYGIFQETTHGLSTYKFEEAARREAAGVLIIQDASGSGDDWEQLRDSVPEQWSAIDDGRDETSAMAEGWLSEAGADKVLQFVGADFAKLKEDAGQLNFRPVAWDTKISIEITNSVERDTATNVVAVLEAAPPEDATQEYVILSSHWNGVADMDTSGQNGRIGVYDNGSGTAVVMETARLLQEQADTLTRGIVFLVSTAEREGLHGLSFYAQEPLVPADATIAHVLFAGSNVYDPTPSRLELHTIGPFFSALNELVRVRAVRQGRVLEILEDADKVDYYSDTQVPFAVHGIRQLFLATTPVQLSQAREQAIDTLQTDWPIDARGAALDADLLFQFVSDVSNATNWPRPRSTQATGRSR
jgi:Zn-dependent M28 family amino/carboxypeptidase